ARVHCIRRLTTRDMPKRTALQFAVDHHLALEVPDPGHTGDLDRRQAELIEPCGVFREAFRKRAPEIGGEAALDAEKFYDAPVGSFVNFRTPPVRLQNARVAYELFEFFAGQGPHVFFFE